MSNTNTNIAIDLGGTRIKLGAVQNDTLLQSRMIEAQSGKGLAARLCAIKEEVLSLMDSADLSGVTSVGIAFPGLVDTHRNCVLGTNGKYSDAHSLDLQQWFATELGLNLKMENDARLACLGEWKYGAGRGSNNVVMCTLGTGIGSSAVIDGKILRGKHFQAGVLGGHFILDYQNSNAQCTCGNTGCLESVASTSMIAGKAKSHPLYRQSLLSAEPLVDLQSIFSCAQKGDRLANELKEHCLYAWSMGLVNLVHAYDPEVIVVGGGIANAQDTLIPYFNNIIKAKAWTPWGSPEVRVARYPDTAALLGVGALFND